MAKFTPDRLCQRLLDLQLVEQRELQEARNQLDRNASADELLQNLIGHELLTSWQVDRIRKDYRIGFFYGKYKILYLAGSGSFARVFRAVHRESGLIYAVKALRSRHADDDDVVSQFVREAEVGEKLKHPNIVHIYEHGRERAGHYLVMDFVEGQTLKELVRIRKRIDAEEATRIMLELANGLRHAAQLGYTHRDIKMTNVLISTKGQAKWIDFGLAKKKDEETPRTVDYAGLEKASGAPKDDPRSDLFFLGCLYYHMLAGQPPLEESRDRAVRGAKSRFLNVAPLQHVASGLPRPVVAVVDRATQLNPTYRYQSPSEMLVELKRVAAKLKSGDEDPGASRVPLVADPGSQRPVMIVESNADMQQALREGLKKSGYRVLLTGDPQRALARFEDEPGIAQCAIFSTNEIGEAALEAFNRFGEDEHTKKTPAILLLQEDQRKWKSRANLNKWRMVLHMPLKLKLLRAALATLLQR